VLASAQGADADLLALQVADGANRFVREQLEAPGMHTRERRDRQPLIPAKHQRRRQIEAEIELAPDDHLIFRRTVLHGHVAHLGKALPAQQVLGEVPGRDTDGRITSKPKGGHLRRRLVGERCPAKNAGGRGQRRADQEIAATLHDLHQNSP
jgi:hypothetical protein